jgi:hypothetical protein
MNWFVQLILIIITLACAWVYKNLKNDESLKTTDIIPKRYTSDRGGNTLPPK